MALENYPGQLEPVDQDVVIWRFMNMKKLRDLMTTGELYFCRADLFRNDEREGLPPERYLPSLLGLNPLFLRDQQTLNHHLGSLAQFRESFYISCWHLFRDETDAMWKEFGADGVAICSRYSLLKSALDGLSDRAFLGLVARSAHNHWWAWAALWGSLIIGSAYYFFGLVGALGGLLLGLFNGRHMEHEASRARETAVTDAECELQEAQAMWDRVRNEPQKFLPTRSQDRRARYRESTARRLINLRPSMGDAKPWEVRLRRISAIRPVDPRGPIFKSKRTRALRTTLAHPSLHTPLELPQLHGIMFSSQRSNREDGWLSYKFCCNGAAASSAPIAGRLGNSCIFRVHAISARKFCC